MSARFVLRGAGGAALGLALFAGCTSVPEPTAATRTFEFPYVHDYGVVNSTTFDWCDDVLTNSSYGYCQALAGPLSALAASAYGYRLGMDVFTLVELGFPSDALLRHYGEDLDYEDPVYGKDQVGYTFALRETTAGGERRPLLVVVVRGTFGRYEWASNMNLCNRWGRKGDLVVDDMPDFHEGFSLATEGVLAALAKYVQAHDVDLARAKVLVTGHSRGAAVANLVGAALDDAPGGKGPFAAVRPENVFVYTYAAPNTVIGPRVDANVRRYANVFNVLNPEDMVPNVPIVKWNARRYGVDLTLRCYDDLHVTGSWTDAAYLHMKREFKRMTGYEYWHMPFGTNSTQLLPTVLGAVAPTIVDLYAVPPEQRREGNETSVQSILETLVWRCMGDPLAKEKAISLGGDVQLLAASYKKFARPEREDEKEEETPSALSELLAKIPFMPSDGFYVPDGRDFDKQPGFFDLTWRLSCMHATQTYIAWMKAATVYGPDAVYRDWPPPAPSDADMR